MVKSHVGVFEEMRRLCEIGLETLVVWVLEDVMFELEVRVLGKVLVLVVVENVRHACICLVQSLSPLHERLYFFADCLDKGLHFLDEALILNDGFIQSLLLHRVLIVLDIDACSLDHAFKLLLRGQLWHLHDSVLEGLCVTSEEQLALQTIKHEGAFGDFANEPLQVVAPLSDERVMLVVASHHVQILLVHAVRLRRQSGDDHARPPCRELLVQSVEFAISSLHVNLSNGIETSDIVGDVGALLLWISHEESGSDPSHEWIR